MRAGQTSDFGWYWHLSGFGLYPSYRQFLGRSGEGITSLHGSPCHALTDGEISAGSYLLATPRTALDGEHRRLGAQMDRIGGWWCPGMGG